TMGPRYQEMLREGSGMIYGGVKTRDTYDFLARKAGIDIARDPGRWLSILRKIDPRLANTLNAPADLVSWFYGKMRNVLWYANDVFMMQRVMELQRKGMGIREAIKEAEKHIPNYRLPSEIMGSRIMSEVMGNPNLLMFNRYHYGVFNSYANMIKDAVGK